MAPPRVGSGLSGIADFGFHSLGRVPSGFASAERNGSLRSSGSASIRPWNKSPRYQAAIRDSKSEICLRLIRGGDRLYISPIKLLGTCDCAANQWAQVIQVSLVDHLIDAELKRL